MRKFFIIALLIAFNQLRAQEVPKNFPALLSQVEPELINWRHHFHENPELSNREFKTGNYIADFLKSIGLEVKYPAAKTGVLAILKGGKSGPVVGLRADIDALPVTERAPVSFASKVKAEYNGQQVGVMHACGHDAHTAILMATAKVMKQMQKDIPGTIVFFFQPAEEGPPNGEEGGAPLMIKEGAMDNPKIDMMFGLHMASGLPVGQLAYKSGAAQASSDLFKITIHGKGSHGSMPWLGIDPIMISADVLEGIQHIVSRQEDLTKAPLVISVGSIHGGVRSNIIPETVEMNGTIRSLDSAMRKDVYERLKRVVQTTAESAGATADIEINTQTLINYNDPSLVKKTLPALQKAAGDGNLIESRWVTAAEDFSFYGQKAPTFFFSLGGLPKGKDPKDAGPHHTPDFYLDESGFIVGVKAFCFLVFENAKSK
ncbi:MAG: amidohydrolase [Sphingobacteriales bacterium]|nr:amidohydrolase [Sphingobacteriales bacterium]MBI3718719.1 amidohydrolase [Sphingobacteriales bacterium]